MIMDNETIIKSPVNLLRQLTAARVAIGRCGSSLPSGELLDFNLCHARARDAVHIPLDFEKTASDISSSAGVDVVILESMASTREEYLRRPDLGRRLSGDSLKRLDPGEERYDISLSVADGLSSMAIERNAAFFLSKLVPALRCEYTLAPVTLIRHGRVAVADEVARAFRSEMAVIFIGERPGLKSPDSMGIYMTYSPEPGMTDERRNCISNIRAGGMSHDAGVSKLLYLVHESMRRKISGVDLKDEQDDTPIIESGNKKFIT